MPEPKKRSTSSRTAPATRNELHEAEREFAGALREATETFKRMRDPDVLRPRRLYLFFFMRGVLQGLGVLVAAVIVIPLLIPVALFFLRQIEWIPIVGEFVEDVIRQVEEQPAQIAPEADDQ